MLRNVSEVTGVDNNLDLGSTVARLGAGALAGQPRALWRLSPGGSPAMLVSLRYDRETSFMVTVGATMLLAPLLWDHYLVLLILPAALLAQRGHAWGLLLPFLGWLPRELLPLLAICATLVPFAAAERRYPTTDDPDPARDQDRGPSSSARAPAIPAAMDMEATPATSPMTSAVTFGPVSQGDPAYPGPALGAGASSHTRSPG